MFHLRVCKVCLTFFCSSSGGMRGGRRRKDYTPVSWDKYFEHQEEIKVSETNVSFTFVQTSGTYGVRIHFV